MADVSDFNVQLRVFPPQHGQKPGLFNAITAVFRQLFFRAVVGNPLHGRFFGFYQTVFHQPGHDAGHRGFLPRAFRDVGFRPKPLVIVGHALVPQAHLVRGFINQGKHRRHAAHNALQANHRRVRQIRGIHDVHNLHRRHRNAAEPFNAVAGAVQKVPRVIQHGVQALAQHVVRHILVGLIVLQRLPKIRLHVHVGFRVKFAHHFAQDAAAAVVYAHFHVRRHPPAFAHLAVQPQDFGLGQARNAVPVFRNVRRVHAVHPFPLPLRVVLYDRHLLRAVQHLEQTVQRHAEPHHRPHNEMHRFDAAFDVPQLGGALPFAIHLIQQVNRRIML